MTTEERRLQDECHARGGTWIYMPDGGGYGCTDRGSGTRNEHEGSVVPALIVAGGMFLLAFLVTEIGE